MTSKHRIKPETRDRARQLRRELTGPEHKLWAMLRNKQIAGHRFRKQHPIGPFITDFCSVQSNLVVELDGESHVGRAKQDHEREKSLNESGYRVIRFTNDDVLQHPDVVWDVILNALKQCEADRR